jgi:hypothetical protein
MIYSRVAEYRMCAPRPGRRLDLDPAGTSSSPLPSRMATGNTPSKARLAALGRHVCQSRQQPQPQPEPAGGILKWVGQLFTGGGGDARPAPGGDATLRIGIIGLDTSHVPAFTDCLNNPDNEHHVPGALVVAAVKGGSPDMPASADRVEGYTQQLVNDYDVTIYDTVGEMCEHVDAVFLESVDGRAHLAQAAPVIAAGKPLFIDKPMAGSLADGMEIFRLAAQAGGVPVWSSSALRYGPQQQAVRAGSLGAPPDYALTTSPGDTGAGGDNGIDHNKELTEISLRFYIFAIPLSPPAPASPSLTDCITPRTTRHACSVHGPERMCREMGCVAPS